MTNLTTFKLPHLFLITCPNPLSCLSDEKFSCKQSWKLAEAPLREETRHGDFLGVINLSAALYLVASVTTPTPNL